MKKTSAILLIIVFLTSSVALCLADEKDHVCFRALDSNKDDMVTYQEFEKFYENDKEKFNDADIDEDGKLTHDEYHDILGQGSL